MPFLINNKPLSKSEHPEHYEWLEKMKKKVRAESKKVYNFAAFLRPTMETLEDGRTKAVPRRRLTPITTSFEDPDNGLNTYDTWSYIKSLSACKSNGDGTFTPTRKTYMMHDEDVLAIPEDLELIVFFRYMGKNKNIREIDYAKINREKAASKATESQVYYYIFNEHSPVSPSSTGSEKALRNVAMAWKVPGADSKDINEVKNLLWDIVQAADAKSHSGADGRGYNHFCNDVESLGNSEDRSTIQIAIERGVLFFNGDENSWKLQARGGFISFMCGVPLGREDYKEEYIVKHVLSDSYYLKDVKEALDKVPDNVDNYDSWNRDKLIAETEKLGWPKHELIKTSNEELKKRLKGKLVPN